jgi:flagellar hook assembly protein FlgD
VFRFDLPVAAAVEIVVYDPRGRVILKALSGTQMPAGRHEWTWDGRTSSGARVAAGVYLVGLRTPTFSQNVKAVVLD